MSYSGDLLPIANTNTTTRYSDAPLYSGGLASVLCTLLSESWDVDDPDTSVSLLIQQSFDAGEHWDDMTSTVWHPTMNWGKGGPPRLPSLAATAGDTPSNRLCRIALQASADINVGIHATVG